MFSVHNKTWVPLKQKKKKKIINNKQNSFSAEMRVDISKFDVLSSVK